MQRLESDDRHGQARLVRHRSVRGPRVGIVAGQNRFMHQRRCAPKTVNPRKIGRQIGGTHEAPKHAVQEKDCKNYEVPEAEGGRGKSKAERNITLATRRFNFPATLSVVPERRHILCAAVRRATP